MSNNLAPHNTLYCKSILTQIDLRVLPNKRIGKWYHFWSTGQSDFFVTTKDIIVRISDDEDIVVPAGFKTDFASIPWIIRNQFPVIDSHIAAAVIHDYLYRTITQSFRGRKFADEFFLKIMKETNVPKLKRQAIYYGVRAGGWKSYQESNRIKSKKK